MKKNKHPLNEYPENEKVDYLSVIASIAAADGHVSDEEVSHLREFCKMIGISATGIGKVIAAAEDVSNVNIRQVISQLSESDLRFTLVTEMFYLAYADGILKPSEKKEIRKIAKKLNIKDEQTEAIQRYVEAVIKAKDSGSSKEELKRLGGEVAASLTSVGVPIGAVAISGTVFGLSAAGISSGLAALGMGFGMTTGIGVAVGIGVGSYFGVRWLYKKLVGV